MAELIQKSKVRGKFLYIPCQWEALFGDTEEWENGAGGGLEEWKRELSKGATITLT